MWVAKAPHRNGKRAALERQVRITTECMILAPLADSDVHYSMGLGVCYLPSAVVVNAIINDSSLALFLFANRPPSPLQRT